MGRFENSRSIARKVVASMNGTSPGWCIRIALLVALAGTLIACGSAAEEEPAPSITIGLIAPLSGSTPDTGLFTREAAQLAVEQVNHEGGLPVQGARQRVELLIADNENTPEVAIDAARRLIYQEEVAALVGPQWSNNAIPVAKLAEDAAIPMISPESTNPETTRGREYVFRVAFTDDFQGSMIAEFVYYELKAQKAAVLYNVGDEYSSGLAEIFRQMFLDLGGRVVAFETYTSDNDATFNAQLSRIQASNAEVLFLPNYPEDVLRQVQQARHMDFPATLVGSDAWVIDDVQKVPEFEGAFFSQQWYSGLQTPQSNQFISAYRQAYGRTPESTAAATYDAFGLLFAAIEHQDSATSQAIRTGLMEMDVYEGVTGTISYGQTGDPLKSIFMLHVENGSAIFYQQIDP